MKSLFITLLGIILIIPVGLKAQNNKNKIKVHKVWVTLLNGSRLIKGNLYSANKDRIRIVDNDSFDISNLTTINVQDIDVLKIRRKGKVGKGVWIGAVTGLAVGGIIGFASGDDDPDQWLWSSTAEEKALGSGILLSIVGAGVGPLIASKKEVIRLNGNIEIYNEQLGAIQSYSLMRNVKE